MPGPGKSPRKPALAMSLTARGKQKLPRIAGRLLQAAGLVDCTSSDIRPAQTWSPCEVCKPLLRFCQATETTQGCHQGNAASPGRAGRAGPACLGLVGAGTLTAFMKRRGHKGRKGHKGHKMAQGARARVGLSRLSPRPTQAQKPPVERYFRSLGLPPSATHDEVRKVPARPVLVANVLCPSRHTGSLPCSTIRIRILARRSQHLDSLDIGDIGTFCTFC